MWTNGIILIVKRNWLNKKPLDVKAKIDGGMIPGKGSAFHTTIAIEVATQPNLEIACTTLATCRPVSIDFWGVAKR